MTINLKLHHPLVRLAVSVSALAASALLVSLIFSRFVIGTMSDDRFVLDRDWMIAGTNYLPNSPRLNARLAEVELFADDPDFNRADHAATLAVQRSPYDFRWRMILAMVKEAEGDRATAETALRDALRLAPNDRDVHYRLANVLLREGKLADAIGEFRIAIDKNLGIMPGTFDLLWQVTHGNVEAIESVAGTDPKRRLLAAQFLVKQSRITEAATIFRSLDRSARLASTECAALLNAIVVSGNVTLAHELWESLVNDAGTPGSLVYNGSFENDILKNFAQFDWAFERSEYARLSIDRATAHTGTRSLKIEFIGRDTTALGDEVRQLVAVKPGGRYRVECYVKSNQLVTPEGPRIVVTDKSGTWIASSDPVAGGTNDWKPVSFEFVAPNVAPAAAGVYVSVKRRPKFSYDEPTKGTIWVDDFKIDAE